MKKIKVLIVNGGVNSKLSVFNDGELILQTEILTQRVFNKKEIIELLVVNKIVSDMEEIKFKMSSSSMDALNHKSYENILVKVSDNGTGTTSGNVKKVFSNAPINISKSVNISDEMINSFNTEMSGKSNPTSKFAELTKTMTKIGKVSFEGASQTDNTVAVGQEVYVDTVKHFLRETPGGKATVSMIFEQHVTGVSDNDENYDEYDSENDEFISHESQESTRVNILFSIEEIPGVFYSWNELRNRQQELMYKFGTTKLSDLITESAE
jgi:hypothetical protein